MKAPVTLFLILLFVLPVTAQTTITFAWDLSVDDSLLGEGGGYRLYASKQSGIYSTPSGSVAPGVSTITISAPGLGRYYFVARAFTSDGMESDNSNEVSQVIKPKPPTIKSATVAVLTAPVKAATKLAGLFKGPQKGLRIVS